jgi:hypothetical protein
VLEELVDLQGLVPVPWRDREVERPRFPVDDGVELG